MSASRISTADLLDIQHMFAIIADMMCARLYVGNLLQCLQRMFQIQCEIKRCELSCDHYIVDELSIINR
jgi:hypothetical protein